MHRRQEDRRVGSSIKIYHIPRLLPLILILNQYGELAACSCAGSQRFRHVTYETVNDRQSLDWLTLAMA